MKLELDIPAPDFDLTDKDGKIHKLIDYYGNWVILYFYPKDDTPGCTIEACSFRDNYKTFKKNKITIIGISTDNEESHKKFIKKYDLPFLLLSDKTKAFVKKFGFYGKKKFMGKEYEGTYRKSLLINPNGLIKKFYEKVNPEIHAKEVLMDVKHLMK